MFAFTILVAWLFLYPENFMLCKKAVYNGLSLEVYTPFDFQPRT